MTEVDDEFLWTSINLINYFDNLSKKSVSKVTCTFHDFESSKKLEPSSTENIIYGAMRNGQALWADVFA